MLSPSDFFDLEGFAFADLFEDVEYVWEVLERIHKYALANAVDGVRGEVMAGAYLIGDRISIGKGSVVEPGALIKSPCIIGRDTEIRQGAYLRGGVIIGDGCVVGHATEIKNAVLLDGANAPHFNYVGDSILGRRVNLGAGTILSNVKILGKTITVTVQGRKYDTGLRKFGAILGDDTQTGCNSVLNPGTLLGKQCRVYPCASVRGYHPDGTVIKLRQDLEVSEAPHSLLTPRLEGGPNTEREEMAK
jgi:NDP-sugar pyrophosphorylase family protein